MTTAIVDHDTISDVYVMRITTSNIVDLSMAREKDVWSSETAVNTWKTNITGLLHNMVNPPKTTVVHRSAASLQPTKLAIPPGEKADCSETRISSGSSSSSDASTSLFRLRNDNAEGKSMVHPEEFRPLRPEKKELSVMPLSMFLE